MKSISIFLLLFIIKLSISNSSIDEYSIHQFINRIKNEGLFETILQIKKLYGQDLSIIFCEELNKNSYDNCKRLIKEYMPSFAPNNIIKSGYLIDSNTLIRNREFIIKPKYNWDKLKEILRGYFPPEKAELIAKNIITRVEKELGQRQKKEKEKELELEKELEKEKEFEKELEKEKEFEKELEKEKEFKIELEKEKEFKIELEKELDKERVQKH